MRDQLILPVRTYRRQSRCDVVCASTQWLPHLARMDSHCAAKRVQTDGNEDIFIILFCASCTCVASRLELIDVTSVRSGHSRPTGRRTRVRVNNMHSKTHIAGISGALAAARPPWKAHRGLATAVVEELDVSAAKVAVRHAIE